MDASEVGMVITGVALVAMVACVLWNLMSSTDGEKVNYHELSGDP